MNRLSVKQRWILVGFCLILAICSGCGREGGTAAEPVMAPVPVFEGGGTAAMPAGEAESGDFAIEVNGVKLTKAKLDEDVDKRIAGLREQIHAQQLPQARAEIRQALIDEFVIRTLLAGEIQKRKISVTEKEISDMLTVVESQLPSGVTIDSLQQENLIDLAKIREDIAMKIGINKMVLRELGNKAKVTNQEVKEFYSDNLNHFKEPESVHARHLLIALAEEDSEEVKAEKKSRAEDLQKRLLVGADFAELAAEYSDCPSKQNGGDLGMFTRGQMIQAFEDAAFSQKKGVIGPVVETNYGFHIIQVMEHKEAQTVKLDKKMRTQIAAFLENQKQEIAVQEFIKKLRADADIVVNGR